MPIFNNGADEYFIKMLITYIGVQELTFIRENKIYKVERKKGEVTIKTLDPLKVKNLKETILSQL